MSDDIIKRLRKAIAAGPTLDRHGWPQWKQLENLASAGNIRLLLDRLDAAELENERLRQLEQSVSIALPNVYYMDPPDGGDVPVLEQLRRMAKDAARYRWLRRKFAIIPTARSASAFVPVNLPQPTHIAPDAAVELDAVIDAARAAEQREWSEE